MKKLATATKRPVPEWIGRTPATTVPDGVRMRVWERQGGKCAITGLKIKTGDKKRLDHRIPIADWTGEGHGNRESNLQWILDEPHKAKTAKEASIRKKVRRKASAHAGIRKPPARKLESRNDLPAKLPPKIKKIPVPTHLPTQIERLAARYGIPPPTGRKR